MRPDTLQALKELDSPLYRWPGGNFVSGYDWRDGLGDADRRPPRKNPAWQGVEHNDFGLHEFLDFCGEVKAEPMIVVNTGFGDAHSAAQEVEYVNGDRKTPMGGWRARNGHPNPWKVVWWGVGNEMWGPWQLGHMPLNQYVLKHNDVERKMRKVDPTIVTVASGDLGRGWSEGMLKNSADHMNFIAEHFYVQERPQLAEHVAQVGQRIREKAEAHRRYRKSLASLHDKDIRVAMTEWNYWYGPHIYGELGTRYFLKDALGIAAGVHEFSRHTDIISMASYAQTVNVIGAVKTTKTAAALETTGLVLKLYRTRYGTLPLKVEGAPPLLDVAAAFTEGRKALTVGVVNPSATVQTLTLSVTGTQTNGTGKAWRIAGSDPMLYNEPGAAPRVNIVESEAGAPTSLAIPPYSITLYRWEVRP
jgi:alpha-L-arabinofuranosidase